MSKIAVSSPASGTATYTISAPAGSTDRTITLPDATGTLVTNTAGTVTQTMLATGVAGNGPAFSAFSTVNQSFANNTFTKATFPSEEFDTNSCYDTALYRFTPTVAGYYEVAVSFSMSGSVTLLNATVFKNGSLSKGASSVSSSAIGLTTQVNAMVYLNGSTDYIEAYMIATGTSPILAAGAAYTFFQAFLARSAT